MKAPAEVIIRLFDAWKSGDIEAYLDCFADSFESAHPFGHTTDHAHIRNEIELVVEHWTDREFQVLGTLSEDDAVAIEYTMSMTGTGRGFEGQVVLPGLVQAIVRDGRIIRYREEFDPRIVLAARVARGAGADSGEKAGV